MLYLNVHLWDDYIVTIWRNRLAKVIPGLRPWEVLSVEQAMDMITYNGEWCREPLGSYATGPPYVREWNRDVKRMLRIFHKLSIGVCNKMERTIPGFDLVMDKLRVDIAAKEARRKEIREARKKALAEAALRRSSSGI